MNQSVWYTWQDGSTDKPTLWTLTPVEVELNCNWNTSYTGIRWQLAQRETGVS